MIISRKEAARSQSPRANKRRGAGLVLGAPPAPRGSARSSGRAQAGSGPLRQAAAGRERPEAPGQPRAAPSVPQTAAASTRPKPLPLLGLGAPSYPRRRSPHRPRARARRAALPACRTRRGARAPPAWTPLAPRLRRARCRPPPSGSPGGGRGSGEGGKGGGGGGGGVRRRRGLLVHYKITKNKWKTIKGFKSK